MEQKRAQEPEVPGVLSGFGFSKTLGFLWVWDFLGFLGIFLGF